MTNMTDALLNHVEKSILRPISKLCFLCATPQDFLSTLDGILWEEDGIRPCTRPRSDTLARARAVDGLLPARPAAAN